ncbi:tRNA (adenosine(37)-N6)-dimethylallyltransferase MiaA [Vicingaceae bacterium]|nr:tRNA (adenosine(37)-N6)-dimethylallyltransferase MiaA [Vicingaceae bacterium]MDA9782805.1 tRNA (adenosine(37)-N6)-dimethylallyltransferase MiaA [Vicingaceae bacterium]MDB4061867.1 tRNA (adenosine(37)-N6)-dimethylallyltransferase MiaA [Vicingaceae bacterium]MDB9963470.1 tRNA (adenosine(37)-N6)-dimethylallyltransferase MiaA [Vicingaceae bacterium]MDC1451655.1 tRNA (adenosine(37)-N6)-dimethylallyltransferase MiaA [Vicingaceae bacterium]
MRKTLISIVGPTAVGKTSTAINIAKQLDAEIISSDSRQFYKEISIGTAKPTELELKQVPHHFINHLSITEEYNASKFENEVIEFLDSYFKNKDTAILCGGSGMYNDAVIKGFDNEIPTADAGIREELKQKYEEQGLAYLQDLLLNIDQLAYQNIDIRNSKRLMRAIEICKLTGKTNTAVRKGIEKKRNFDIIQIGLELPRNLLYDRINQRVDLMIHEGLIDEVKSVVSHREKNALNTVGYKEIFDYLDGIIPWNLAVEKIKTNSRRYAKRQLTWFKRNERIKWFLPNEINKISKYIRTTIQNT